MALLLITTTTILMFLAFGSLVLPIKAALMSALTLGSTMGVLTWMFVDGHGSGVMNYTPQPLMAPMIGLIIAVIWGLSTDYEVFLVSRMVEARERGMSTTEAIRIGTATTGRLITGAALVLAVVAGAFVFSDLVMMKYLAFGLLIALLLDATIVRMFLVPAIMKMLGDDCWWAPRWMKRLQNKIGLGDTHLPDERKLPTARAGEPALVGAGAPAAERALRPHDPTHPGQEGASRPRLAARPRPPQDESTARIAPPQDDAESDVPTTRFASARNAVRSAVTTATDAVTQRQAAAPTAADRRAGNRVVAGRSARYIGICCPATVFDTVVRAHPVDATRRHRRRSDDRHPGAARQRHRPGRIGRDGHPRDPRLASPVPATRRPPPSGSTRAAKVRAVRAPTTIRTAAPTV